MHVNGVYARYVFLLSSFLQWLLVYARATPMHELRANAAALVVVRT